MVVSDSVEQYLTIPAVLRSVTFRGRTAEPQVHHGVQFEELCLVNGSYCRQLFTHSLRGDCGADQPRGTGKSGSRRDGSTLLMSESALAEPPETRGPTKCHARHSHTGCQSGQADLRRVARCHDPQAAPVLCTAQVGGARQMVSTTLRWPRCVLRIRAEIESR